MTFTPLIPADVRASVRRTRDMQAAIAAYHATLAARLRPEPIPLVEEQVIPIGQSYEARLAREHLASLSAERLAEIEQEWNDV